MIHLLYILAIWRVTNLVTNENGPFAILERMRRYASRVFKEGIDAYCFWCMSVLVSFVAVGLMPDGSLVQWFAYSAGAILIEEFLPVRIIHNVEERKKD